MAIDTIDAVLVQLEPAFKLTEQLHETEAALFLLDLLPIVLSRVVAWKHLVSCNAAPSSQFYGAWFSCSRYFGFGWITPIVRSIESHKPNGALLHRLP
jgi:hypothetical protein